MKIELSTEEVSAAVLLWIKQEMGVDTTGWEAESAWDGDHFIGYLAQPGPSNSGG